MKNFKHAIFLILFIIEEALNQQITNVTIFEGRGITFFTPLNNNIIAACENQSNHVLIFDNNESIRQIDLPENAKCTDLSKDNLQNLIVTTDKNFFVTLFSFNYYSIKEIKISMFEEQSHMINLDLFSHITFKKDSKENSLLFYNFDAEIIWKHTEKITDILKIYDYEYLMSDNLGIVYKLNYNQTIFEIQKSKNCSYLNRYPYQTIDNLQIINKYIYVNTCNKNIIKLDFELNEINLYDLGQAVCKRNLIPVDIGNTNLYLQSNGDGLIYLIKLNDSNNTIFMDFLKEHKDGTTELVQIGEKYYSSSTDGSVVEFQVKENKILYKNKFNLDGQKVLHIFPIIIANKYLLLVSTNKSTYIINLKKNYEIVYDFKKFSLTAHDIWNNYLCLLYDDGNMVFYNILQDFKKEFSINFAKNSLSKLILNKLNFMIIDNLIYKFKYSNLEFNSICTNSNVESVKNIGRTLFVKHLDRTISIFKFNIDGRIPEPICKYTSQDDNYYLIPYDEENYYKCNWEANYIKIRSYKVSETDVKEISIKSDEMINIKKYIFMQKNEIYCYSNYKVISLNLELQTSKVILSFKNIINDFKKITDFEFAISFLDIGIVKFINLDRPDLKQKHIYMSSNDDQIDLPLINLVEDESYDKVKFSLLCTYCQINNSTNIINNLQTFYDINQKFYFQIIQHPTEKYYLNLTFQSPFKPESDIQLVINSINPPIIHEKKIKVFSNIQKFDLFDILDENRKYGLSDIKVCFENIINEQWILDSNKNLAGEICVEAAQNFTFNHNFKLKSDTIESEIKFYLESIDFKIKSKKSVLLFEINFDKTFISTTEIISIITAILAIVGFIYKHFRYKTNACLCFIGICFLKVINCCNCISKLITDLEIKKKFYINQYKADEIRENQDLEIRNEENRRVIQNYSNTGKKHLLIED